MSSSVFPLYSEEEKKKPDVKRKEKKLIKKKLKDDENLSDNSDENDVSSWTEQEKDFREEKKYKEAIIGRDSSHEITDKDTLEHAATIQNLARAFLIRRRFVPLELDAEDVEKGTFLDRRKSERRKTGRHSRSSTGNLNLNPIDVNDRKNSDRKLDSFGKLDSFSTTETKKVDRLVNYDHHQNKNARRKSSFRPPIGFSVQNLLAEAGKVSIKEEDETSNKPSPIAEKREILIPKISITPPVEEESKNPSSPKSPSPKTPTSMGQRRASHFGLVAPKTTLNFASDEIKTSPTLSTNRTIERRPSERLLSPSELRSSDLTTIETRKSPNTTKRNTLGESPKSTDHVHGDLLRKMSAVNLDQTQMQQIRKSLSMGGKEGKAMLEDFLNQKEKLMYVPPRIDSVEFEDDDEDEEEASAFS